VPRVACQRSGAGPAGKWLAGARARSPAGRPRLDWSAEPEVFGWAARAADLTSRAHHEPAATALGHTQLTIDHFAADGT